MPSDLRGRGPRGTLVSFRTTRRCRAADVLRFDANLFPLPSAAFYMLLVARGGNAAMNGESLRRAMGPLFAFEFLVLSFALIVVIFEYRMVFLSDLGH